MKQYLDLKGTTECPHCGAARATTATIEDSQIVLDWLEKRGLKPREAIREFRHTSTGFSFQHGGNYKITEDMLGGKGDGATEAEFLKDTGLIDIRYPSGGVRSVVCRECAKWL